MIRASLAELARQRSQVPILLLPLLIREGWADCSGRDLCSAGGAPHLEVEQLAYDAPDDLRLELPGCETIARLAVVVAQDLPPGPDRQGRKDVAGAPSRARFAASVLRESGRLLEGSAFADLTFAELAVGFSVLCFAQHKTREGRASSILWSQLQQIVEGGAASGLVGPAVPDRGPIWDEALLRFLQAVCDISIAAERAAAGAQDGRSRQSMEALARGWRADARLVRAWMVQRDAQAGKAPEGPR